MKFGVKKVMCSLRRGGRGERIEGREWWDSYDESMKNEVRSSGGQVGVEGVGGEGEGCTLGRNIIQIDVYSTGSFAPELMGRRFMSYVNKLNASISSHFHR